jgi:dephospho-CoA kinase
MSRLAASRGWSREELARRESWQLPLDFKRDRADYVVHNNADADALSCEVREVFARMIRPEGL